MTKKRELVNAVLEAKRELIKQNEDYNDAIHINSGSCTYFAQLVVNNKLNKPEDVSIKKCFWAHTWIEHNGIHYDAEKPNGIKEYENFPVWSRVSLEVLEKASRDYPRLKKLK